MAETDPGHGVHNEVHGNPGGVVQAGVVKQVNLYQPAAPKRLRVDLVVDRPATIECVSTVSTLASSWLEAECARLTTLAEEYDWSRNQQWEDDLHSRQEALRRGTFPDGRTRAVYESHVEQYLSQAKQVLEERSYLLHESHPEAGVELVIENLSDKHYRGVEVVVSFTGAVRSLCDALDGLPVDWPSLPPIPAPPGTSGDLFKYHQIMAPPRRLTEQRRVDLGPGEDAAREGWSAEDVHGGTTVTFEVVDLRPRQGVRLPAVPLLIGARPGESVDAHWFATAEDADGECSGSITFDVAPSTLDLSEIFEPGPPRSNSLSLLESTALFGGLLATAWAERRRKSSS